jgi:hypothetical protein
VNLDKSLKLYQLNDTEKMLHGARVTLTGVGFVGFVGMITSMKVLGRKDWSSMFELAMGGAFVAFLITFYNQAKIVQISITSKLDLGEGLEIETALEIEDVDDDDEVHGGRGKESEEARARKAAARLSMIAGQTHVRKISKWGSGSPLIKSPSRLDEGHGGEASDSDEEEFETAELRRRKGGGGEKKIYSFAKRSVLRARAFTE